MCLRSACLLFAIVTTLSASSAASAVEDPAGKASVIQTQIDISYQAALAAIAGAPDRAARDAATDNLITINQRDLNRLVPQVVLYAARNEKDPAALAVAGHVFKRLQGDKQGVIAALAPLLDDADAAIRKLTADLLRGYEDRSAVRPPDFTVYHALLEADFRALRSPQSSLVQFMFEGDPGAALLTIMRASQLRDPAEIKPILWAEHVVADLLWRRQFGFVKRDAVDPAVVRELDKLSQHKSWWARMYVAEIIRKYPELGTKVIRDRLAADPHDLVKSALPSTGSSK